MHCAGDGKEVKADRLREIGDRVHSVSKVCKEVTYNGEKGERK